MPLHDVCVGVTMSIDEAQAHGIHIIWKSSVPSSDESFVMNYDLKKKQQQWAKHISFSFLRARMGLYLLPTQR